MKTGVSINDLHQRFAFDEMIGKLAEIGYDCVDFAFTGTYGRWTFSPGRATAG